MRRMTRILCFTILLTLCVCGVNFAYAATPAVAQWEIDLGVESSIKNPARLFLGEQQLLASPQDIKPVIIRGTTLIPARDVFEAMGYKVTWIEQQKVVLVTGQGKEIRLTLNSKKALVNNVEKELAIPAMIIDHDKDGIGSTMVPLRTPSEMLGCKVEWLENENKIVIELPKKAPKEETANVDDVPDTANIARATEPTTEEIAIAKKLVTPAVDYSTSWNGDMLNENARGKIIVIDIGHGGKDRGAVAHENQEDELTEKAANLPVGLKLYENLTKAGAKVYLTRDTDIYYTLKERAGMANGIKATIFVSIHNNSTITPVPNGTETIYNTKVSKDGYTEKELYGIASKDIAKNVQKEMVAELGTFDRGTKNRPELGVVRRTNMPAIIVEGAFLSNEDDLLKMKKADFSDKYARAVAQGLIKSMNEAFK